jgi:hypothetical protein
MRRVEPTKVEKRVSLAAQTMDPCRAAHPDRSNGPLSYAPLPAHC